MALDFHRDGTFLLHFADETTTGKWRITRKEGDKVTVTLAIPGAASHFLLNATQQVVHWLGVELVAYS